MANNPRTGGPPSGAEGAGLAEMTVLSLDTGRRSLYDSAGRIFDPAGRQWNGSPVPGDGLEITPTGAVKWLQKESKCPFRVPVGVIGGREADTQQLALAETIGEGLAGLGLTVLCGGRGGVMEAACRGVERGGGLSVGLLPDQDWSLANPHVGVPLATGIGVARNAIIARAAFALIAIGGGHGTLSEIAFGLQFGRPVFGLPGAPSVEGVIGVSEWHEVEAALCRLVLAL